MTERPSRRAVVMSTLIGGSTLAFSQEGPGRAAEAVKPPMENKVRPVPADRKVTVERRGGVVLIGINRPDRHNRVDPETFRALARAYSEFDGDPLLRAAVLFGHGENFSRGIDVDAFAEEKKTAKPRAFDADEIDPLGRRRPLRKPLVAVVHGDTWNMGHELFLVADIRIASAETRFGQDENTHGRFPGGGSTVRFPREAGWGNAMRYMLTGDHWGAEEARRMGLVQEIAPDPELAFQAGLVMADKIAQCGPLGIKTTLASAHVAMAEGEGAAFSKIEEQYRSLYDTEDFREGRKAEAEGRTPVYVGR